MNWTTKDGREIPIVAMEDEHLLNTIKFIWERREGYKQKLYENMLEYGETESHERRLWVKVEAIAMLRGADWLIAAPKATPHLMLEAYLRGLPTPYLKPIDFTKAARMIPGRNWRVHFYNKKVLSCL